ncbi:hypothetical protein D9619_008320 [Psilocybe cf. subviscida]|uniref:Cytochrome P450 n=1 Tax=Psilocybe cf. subviscida TaxID=2480587 RepID=A0A8H5F0Y6_9AGAR|nr:hypothetical protein D9619_008320 [Psilocybe cf. subviscida]
MSSYLLFGSVSLLVPVVAFFCISDREKPFAGIPGPSPTSWPYGNMLELLFHAPYGQHEFEWQKRYGRVYSIKGCIGEDRLMVSDPITLRHILADTGDFRKCPQHQLINKRVFGDGSVLYAHGAEHRRIRNIMLPAFSVNALLLVVPKLQAIAEELRESWAKSLESDMDEGGVVDIFPDIHETTLKAVTQCIMGYDMAADEAYIESYRNLVITGAKRSKLAILTHSVLLALPDWVVTALTYFPPRDFATLLRFRKMSDTRSSKFLKSKIEARTLGIESDGEKSLFDVMLDTYLKTPDALTLEEIQNQFGTITVAGEDTTANTLIWAFYELSRNHDWQIRLREEINVAQERSKERTPQFYDSMPFLNALIKEVVRFYNALPYTERIAVRDTVLPVSKAITSRSGKKVTEIPVKKGQYVEIAIASYNRLPDIWGEDAEHFDPLRWLDGRVESTTEGALGPYANVLTFIGGPRTCIGWRFAVLEVQVVLCDLIRHVHIDNLDPAATSPVHAISLAPLRKETNGQIGMPLKLTFI